MAGARGSDLDIVVFGLRIAKLSPFWRGLQPMRHQRRRERGGRVSLSRGDGVMGSRRRWRRMERWMWGRRNPAINGELEKEGGDVELSGRAAARPALPRRLKGAQRKPSSSSSSSASSSSSPCSPPSSSSGCASERRARAPMGIPVALASAPPRAIGGSRGGRRRP